MEGSTPRRSTRLTVLGKRPHQPDSTSTSSAPPLPPTTSPTAPPCEQVLPTPDNTPNPKRARISSSFVEGDGNKENIAPFRTEGISDLISPVTPRSLRRTTTESTISPSRTRSGMRRYASSADVTSATPSTAIAQLTISTPPPTPPNSLLPIHARARMCLRATNVAEMAGRSDERAKIQTFIESFLLTDANQQTTASSLYISGSPGTGKTALVNSVIRSLDITQDSCKFIVVNCMALANIDGLWDRLLEELDQGMKRKTAGRVKRLKGREALEVLLVGVRTKCVIVLDELDHIAASTSSLVSLFTLPQAAPNTLRVVGIANTHTLTSRLSQFSADCNKGVDTLHFAPYTPAQLLAILQTRLIPLYENKATVESEKPKQFLPVPTLTLLTKKIASQTGDVRSLFEVLRGAIDLAVAPGTQSASDNPLATPTPAVTPAHVLAALKAYSPTIVTSRTTATRQGGNSSEIMSKVANLGIQARLVLLATLLAFKRLDAGLGISSTTAKVQSTSSKSPVKRTRSLVNMPATGGIETTLLHMHYRAVLTRANNDMFAPVSRSEFGDLLGMLEVVGLVGLSSSSSISAVMPSTPSKSGKRGFGRTASFGTAASKLEEVRLADGVRGDEALRGLGISSSTRETTSDATGDVMAQEIRAIWERERVRLQRDVKASEKSQGVSGLDAFDEAMED